MKLEFAIWYPGSDHGEALRILAEAGGTFGRAEFARSTFPGGENVIFIAAYYYLRN